MNMEERKKIDYRDLIKATDKVDQNFPVRKGEAYFRDQFLKAGITVPDFNEIHLVEEGEPTGELGQLVQENVTIDGRVVDIYFLSKDSGLKRIIYLCDK